MNNMSPFYIRIIYSSASSLLFDAIIYIYQVRSGSLRQLPECSSFKCSLVVDLIHGFALIHKKVLDIAYVYFNVSVCMWAVLDSKL